MSRIRSCTSCVRRRAAVDGEHAARAEPPRPRRRRARPPSARCASSPSTSTSRSPVASRNSSVREARSSRPPSRTMTWSLTRSSSPSRWRGDDHRDAEVAPDPLHQPEHLVTGRGVEAVGGLVEQHQPGVVDERLGELGLLLHAGGVAAHRPVALLGEPDVAQHLGGPLAGGHPGQARHHRQVDDEVARAHVRRQAVVLGQVADRRRGSRSPSVAMSCPSTCAPPAGRRDQAEQDLEQRRLAGAVGADQTGDARRRSRGRARRGRAPDRSPWSAPRCARRVPRRSG